MGRGACGDHVCVSSGFWVLISVERAGRLRDKNAHRMELAFLVLCGFRTFAAGVRLPQM